MKKKHKNKVRTMDGQEEIEGEDDCCENKSLYISNYNLVNSYLWGCGFPFATSNTKPSIHIYNKYNV